MTDPATPSDTDPRPVEPIEPDLNECCGNGCMPCVFDTYADERHRWQEAVKAWDLRHPAAPPGSAPDAATPEPGAAAPAASHS